MSALHRDADRAVYSPRYYQREAMDACYAHWDTEPERGALLVLATGTGKTETGLGLVVDFIEAGKRVVWLAHREELVAEPATRLARYWPQHAHLSGIVQADRDAPDAMFLCASVATLNVETRLAAVLEHGQPDLIVVDEAHHSTAPSHRKVIDALRGANTLLLGLTATPDREDGADLGEHWDIVYSYVILDAIRDGFLVSPYAVIKVLPNLDLSRVSGKRDYDEGELGRELLLAGIVEHTVKCVAETHLATRLPDRGDSRYVGAEGRGGIIFTATVEQAELTATALREAGLRARFVCGDTPTADRRRLIAAFKSGTIDVLCNAAVLTEGTDLPRASWLAFARPTKSWSLFVQMIGRGLRLYDEAWAAEWGDKNIHDERYRGKRDCLVIDLVGATDLHNLVAAPVLIGGTRCPKSADGVHDYQPAADGDPRGVCSHCGGKVSCMAALEATGTGSHSWKDGDAAGGGKRTCTHCGRQQCEPSKDGRHSWVHAEDFKKQCIDCGLEISDPHAGMVGPRGGSVKIDFTWLYFGDLEPYTRAIDVDDRGYIYVVRAGEKLWRAAWLPKGARNLRWIVQTPSEGWVIEAMAHDLIKRARRYPDIRTRVTGAQFDVAARLRTDLRKCRNAGEAQLHLSWAKARERAIATGIAREAS